jgi:hypothetical protein
MVEVTVRTVHGRFLLRPSHAVNDLVVGVIGRAQKKYGMRIHALAVLSNHYLCAAAHKRCYVERRIMWSF